MALFGRIPLASIKERRMRINWIYSATYRPNSDETIDRMKEIAPGWGSWRAWRDCKIDNVVCYDKGKAQELLSRAFQSVCNFYIPRSFYQDLGRPLGVKLFEGEYKELVDDLEDVIAMHLVAPQTDLVLLSGFDLSTPVVTDDRYEKHRIKNRMGLIYQTMLTNPEIQWILVDHSKELDKNFQKLPNVTCDVMKNVLELLV